MHYVIRAFLAQVTLSFVTANAETVQLRGDGMDDIVVVQPDGRVFNNSILGEQIPDTYQTSVIYKSMGTVFNRIDYYVDTVLMMAPLAVNDGWNSGFPSKILEGIGIKARLRSSVDPGSPGWQVKTVFWSLSQIIQYLKAQNQYQEVSFWSNMDAASPKIGFGQLQALSTMSGQTTVDWTAMANDTNFPNDSLSSPDNQSEEQETTFSRGKMLKRIPQPNIYCSDIYRTSTRQLSDYGIYTAIIWLLRQQAEAASRETALGLDTVVQGMIAVHNRDYDVSVALGPTSPRSESLTIRKAILALPNLASRMAEFTGLNRFRPVDFKIREGEGNIIGNGVIVRGLPPRRPGSSLLQIGESADGVLISNSTLPKGLGFGRALNETF